MLGQQQQKSALLSSTSTHSSNDSQDLKNNNDKLIKKLSSGIEDEFKPILAVIPETGQNPADISSGFQFQHRNSKTSSIDISKENANNTKSSPPAHLTISDIVGDFGIVGDEPAHACQSLYLDFEDTPEMLHHHPTSNHHPLHHQLQHHDDRAISLIQSLNNQQHQEDVDYESSVDVNSKSQTEDNYASISPTTDQNYQSNHEIDMNSPAETSLSLVRLTNDPKDRTDGRRVDRTNFADVSRHALDQLERAKEIFLSCLAYGEFPSGPLTAEIIQFHLVPRCRRQFNHFVRAKDCVPTNRQLSEQERLSVSKGRKTPIWFSSVTFTPEAQRVFMAKCAAEGRPLPPRVENMHVLLRARAPDSMHYRLTPQQQRKLRKTGDDLPIPSADQLQVAADHHLNRRVQQQQQVQYLQQQQQTPGIYQHQPFQLNAPQGITQTTYHIPLQQQQQQQMLLNRLAPNQQSSYDFMVMKQNSQQPSPIYDPEPFDMVNSGIPGYFNSTSSVHSAQPSFVDRSNIRYDSTLFNNVSYQNNLQQPTKNASQSQQHSQSQNMYHNFGPKQSNLSEEHALLATQTSNSNQISPDVNSTLMMKQNTIHSFDQPFHYSFVPNNLDQTSFSNLIRSDVGGGAGAGGNLHQQNDSGSSLGFLGPDGLGWSDFSPRQPSPFNYTTATSNNANNHNVNAHNINNFQGGNLSASGFPRMRMD